MDILRLFMSSEHPNDNLRIIITRHGERADFALGSSWYRRMKRNGMHEPRISPLPMRYKPDEWTYDPPLTREGEQQSAHVGRKLKKLGLTIDYCYSSPAFRSIQTATKILESQGRKNISTWIEPGLFECPSWYEDGPLCFIRTDELERDRRFNIDSTYKPIFERVNPKEDERDYYRRSRHLIEKIIQNHKNTGGTILLSGHGGSIEAVTRGLRGFGKRRGNTTRLIQEALRVDYCNFAILERHAESGKWMVHLPESSNNAFFVELNEQSIIPLYGIESHHHAEHHHGTHHRHAQRHHHHGADRIFKYQPFYQQNSF